MILPVKKTKIDFGKSILKRLKTGFTMHWALFTTKKCILVCISEKLENEYDIHTMSRYMNEEQIHVIFDHLSEVSKEINYRKN